MQWKKILGMLLNAGMIGVLVIEAFRCDWRGPINQAWGGWLEYRLWNSLALFFALVYVAALVRLAYHRKPEYRRWAVSFLLFQALFFWPPYLLILLLLGEGYPGFIFFPAINALTVFVYGRDKARAAEEEGRIPELLLLTPVLGGAFPGAYGACFIFRHKTKKFTFRMGLIGATLLFFVLLFSMHTLLR